MYKLIILIETPHDIQTFEESWPLFLREAEKIPGLQREAAIQVVDTLFGESQIYKIHELFFDTKRNLQNGMASPSGQASGRILQQITAGKMTLLIAGHREDSIENLRKYHEANSNSS